VPFPRFTDGLGKSLQFGRDWFGYVIQASKEAVRFYGIRDTSGTAAGWGQQEWLFQAGNESITTVAPAPFTATVTFPRAFPSDCVSVVVCINITTIIAITNRTATGFVIETANVGVFDICWQAVGY
jgi:hypothetical protein